MRFPKHVLAAAAVALLSLCATGAATATGSPHGTTGAGTVPPRDRSTVLVKWTKPPPAGVVAVGDLKTKVKIVKVPKLWTVDQTLAFYRAMPGVAYAEPNYVAEQHGLAAPNDPYFSQQWGLAKIDAFEGWGVYPGSYSAAGAPIAIVDSGIDGTHPDLAGQVAPGANCTTGVCLAGGLSIDDNGHGTVNAGAAAAATNNSHGIAGVAHGARLLPVKVLGAAGTGTYAAIAAGIIWAADNGAKVINLSLGGTADSRTLCDAVTYALDRGVFVDAASGNLSIDDPVYPAACRGVVGVGATDQDDAVPAWSDSGSPNVFVSAPGVSIHATYPGDRYALATGTSVSTALVSGLASLLYAQDPTRTPAELRRILATTSDKVGPASAYGADPYHTCAGCTWSATAGYGRINVFRALSTRPAELAAPIPAVPVPPPTPSSSPPPAAAPPAPNADFAVAVAPASASVIQGANATYTLSIAGQNGFGGTVSLAVSGLPAGATAAFAPASVPASGSSTLTVSAAGETSAGSYTLTVQGTSGSLVHTASLTLTVAAPAAPPAEAQSDFSLSATPGSRIVKFGKAGLITVKAIGTRSGPVAGVRLSVSGLPKGVTASFQPLASGIWMLTLDVAPTATRFQTATVSITGLLGSLTRTTTVVITVL